MRDEGAGKERTETSGFKGKVSLSQKGTETGMNEDRDKERARPERAVGISGRGKLNSKRMRRSWVAGARQRNDKGGPLNRQPSVPDGFVEDLLNPVVADPVSHAR